MSLCLSLSEKVGCVARLHDVSHDLASRAKAFRERIDREEARHRAAMEDIAEQFDIEVWLKVERHWGKDEILDALPPGHM